MTASRVHRRWEMPTEMWERTDQGEWQISALEEACWPSWFGGYKHRPDAPEVTNTTQIMCRGRATAEAMRRKRCGARPILRRRKLQGSRGGSRVYLRTSGHSNGQQGHAEGAFNSTAQRRQWERGARINTAKKTQAY